MAMQDVRDRAGGDPKLLVPRQHMRKPGGDGSRPRPDEKTAALQSRRFP
jgi:hypothetical protein